jgi:hypothetical protein
MPACLTINFKNHHIMKRKNSFGYILLPLVVILAAAAFYIYKEYNRFNKDTAQLKTDYRLKAVDLIREFETNEPASGKKYWDKVIEAEGMVKDVVKDERGFYSVMLGDTAFTSSVKCSMDSLHNNEAVTVHKGHFLTVKGICAGFNADELLGSDVILVRCLIDKKK